MEVRIQGIHFDVTEKLTAFINKKVERLIRRNTNIDYVDVNLTVLKKETSMNKQALMKVIAPHIEEIVATKVANTFEEAVDLAIEAIERQLERADAKR